MIGQTIQNYQILDKIGEGGMGVVYLGKDEMLDRKVAIKVLHARLLNDADLLERFKTEAKLLSMMNHTNIAALYNFIKVDDSYAMVMEFVDGIPLDDLLNTYKQIPVEYAAGLVHQALEGLSFAHNKGIIHRDLKLSNLILSHDGTVKIMDFGIARAVGSSRLTSTGRAIGTLAYMSPEQIKGGEGDKRSDIYSTGIMLYEMLTGDVPFQESTEFELMKAQLEKKPTAPRKQIQNLPVAFDKTILKSLEKLPEKRFATAKGFQKAIRESVPNMATPDKMSLLLNPQTQIISPPTELIGAMNPTVVLPAGTPTKVVTPGAASGSKFSLDSLLSDENLGKRVFMGVAALALLLLLVFAGSRIFSGDDQEPSEDLQTDITKKQVNIPMQEPPVTLTPVSPPVTEVVPPIEDNNPSGVKTITPTKPKKVRTDNTKTERPKSPPPSTPGKPVKTEPAKNDPPPVTKTQSETTKSKSSSYKGTVRIPSGTYVTVRLNERLSSEDKAKDGKPVNMVVTKDVTINGVTIIKAGAPVKAKVVAVGKTLKPPKIKRIPIIGFYVYSVESTTSNRQMLDVDGGRTEQLSDGGGPSVFEKGETFRFRIGEKEVRFR